VKPLLNSATIISVAAVMAAERPSITDRVLTTNTEMADTRKSARVSIPTTRYDSLVEDCIQNIGIKTMDYTLDTNKALHKKQVASTREEKITITDKYDGGQHQVVITLSAATFEYVTDIFVKYYGGLETNDRATVKTTEHKDRSNKTVTTTHRVSRSGGHVTYNFYLTTSKILVNGNVDLIQDDLQSLLVTINLNVEMLDNIDNNLHSAIKHYLKSQKDQSRTNSEHTNFDTIPLVDNTQATPDSKLVQEDGNLIPLPTLQNGHNDGDDEVIVVPITTALVTPVSSCNDQAKEAITSLLLETDTTSDSSADLLTISHDTMQPHAAVVQTTDSAKPDTDSSHNTGSVQTPPPSRRGSAPDPATTVTSSVCIQTAIKQTKNEQTTDNAHTDSHILSRMNTIETSICDILVQMQQILTISRETSNAPSCNCQTNQDTNLAKSIKSVERKVDQLTDSMNRKLSALTNKMPSYSTVTQITTPTNSITPLASTSKDLDTLEIISGETEIRHHTPAGGATDRTQKDQNPTSRSTSTTGSLTATPANSPPRDRNAATTSPDVMLLGDAPGDTEDPRILPPSPTHDHVPPRSPPVYTDVMVIGDSNVRDIRPNGLVFGKKIVRVELTNKTLRGARNFIENMQTKPKQLIIQCGGNDLERNNVQTVLKDARQLLRTATWKLPNTDIHLATVFHTPVPTAKCKRADAELDSLCRSLEVTYMSLFDICFDANRTTFADPKHLNKYGISQVVRLYKTKLYPVFGLDYQYLTTPATPQLKQHFHQNDYHRHNSARNDISLHCAQPWPTYNRFEPLMARETMV
jgi:hypothetical protein